MTKQKIETVYEPKSQENDERDTGETQGMTIVWDEEKQQFVSPAEFAEAQAQNVDDAESDALKELERMKTWKARCDAIAVDLEAAKKERSFWQGECNKLQKNFDALYNKGPNGVADETPLLDQPNVDPDAWKQESIEKSDMPLKLKKKLGEHFQCLGELSDWIGKDFPDKKKGLGPKVREEIAEWFDGYWKKTLDTEMARIPGPKTEETSDDSTSDEAGSFTEEENDLDAIEEEELEDEEGFEEESEPEELGTPF